MSNIRHLLRLHTYQWSKIEIAKQTGIPTLILTQYINDFRKSGLNFEELNELSDVDLEDLFARQEPTTENKRIRTLYNLFPKMERDLKRKGVTQKLLYEEYIAKNPDGLSRGRFHYHFDNWKKRTKPSMRQEHKPGDKLYVDFAGEKLTLYDRKDSGKVKRVEVFVAILGASQLTYVEAVMSQQKEDFIPACENALHFFGGVTAAIVTDNLKCAVIKSDKYEPTINETFADFAEHYNMTVLPARAYKPQDKALVEIAIKLVYTQVYARLRDKKFFTLEELNNAIACAVKDHNDRLMSGRLYSRRKRFEQIERSTLQPLAALKYEFRKQQISTVLKHGHVALMQDKHYYSVPHSYIGKKVKVMYTRSSVDIYHNCDRIATHRRERDAAYDYTTVKEHLPASHRFLSELTSDRVLTWADEIHHDVKLYISKILNQGHHLEKLHKQCLGVLNFSKKVGAKRLIKACRRALSSGANDYVTVKNILERGLDKYQDDQSEELKMPDHENIRGQNYYQ